MFIYPYKAGSNSVKELKQKLPAKVILLQNSKFKGENKFVINWGNSSPNEEVMKGFIMNEPQIVANASNKRKFFELCKDKVSIPEFTTNFEEAQKWVEDGFKVFARETLTGHSGEGIVVLRDMETWGNYQHNRAKLYVKYIPKKQEYRIHIVAGRVILSQRKARKTGLNDEQVNYEIRNNANGFVFAKYEDKGIPQDVFDQSFAAIEATGLDFGAVDVIYNEYRGKAYVLEVNTAPGLQGTTPETYVDALREYYELYKDIITQDKKASKRSIYEYYKMINKF